MYSKAYFYPKEMLFFYSFMLFLFVRCTRQSEDWPHKKCLEKPEKGYSKHNGVCLARSLTILEASKLLFFNKLSETIIAKNTFSFATVPNIDNKWA
jgi:hypothetical protein